MPCKPDVTAWKVLLCACRIHGKCGDGRTFRFFELEPESAAGYYAAAAGNRHLCENVEQQKKERGVKKQLCCTWIKVNNEVHTFVVEIVRVNSCRTAEIIKS
jgi:hypothetical protein